MIASFHAAAADHASRAITLYDMRVSAGQPLPLSSPQPDLLDLNDLLVREPGQTFFVRVSGDSMINANIHDGDLLVVDCAMPAKNEHVVIASLDGDFTVKRIRFYDNCISLLPENPNYPTIVVGEHHEFKIWGVVTSVIHQFVS